MKSIFATAALFMLLSSLAAFGQEDSSSPKISGKFSMYATSVESDNISSKLTGSSIEGHITQKVSEDIEYALKGGILFETGSNKALLIDEFAPNQSAYLRESFVKAQVFGPVSIKLGALNQEMYNSPLLLTDVPFASVMEQAVFEWGSTKLILAAQQAIPNNQDLNQRLGAVQEGTPTFLMNTIGLGHSGDGLGFNLNISHFQYADLSNSVAQNSKILGNSVSGVNENAKFLYDYHGINVYADMKVELGAHTLRPTIQYIFNNGAPDGRNTGYAYGAVLRFGKVEVEALRFKNESDSAVAFYNNKWLGHNNRDGYAAAARYLLPKQKMEFEISFINADLLDSSVYQSQQESVLLRLTRSYDVN